MMAGKIKIKHQVQTEKYDHYCTSFKEKINKHD